MGSIAYIKEEKQWKFVTADNGHVIVPDNMMDLQRFLQTLWDKIFEEDEQDKIRLYNQAAKKYNDAARFQAITIIDNFQKQKEMATKKKAAAKKAAAKPATKKSAIVKKTVSAKNENGTEKKVSQKSQIVDLAEQGKTIDEITELTGIKKSNVQWYFSKLKLGK